MLLSVHDFLPHARLHVFVHVRIGKRTHQPVGPGLIGNARFGNHGFVVVSVVEALHVLELLLVDGPRGEILHRRIDPIIVVGIILKGVDFVAEAAGQRLPEINVRLVRIE